MTQFDSRPINPNKQYLQNLITKYQQTKQVRQYLKKRSVPSLPCFAHNLNKKFDRKNQKSQAKKSKLQIYEQIKKKNRQKFGEWQKFTEKVINQQKYRKQSKINPSNMTVSYKSTQKKINTEEYKKPSYKKSELEQKNDKGQEDKINYEKMMENMKKEMLKIEQQRKEYQIKLQELEFKNRVLQRAQNPIRKNNQMMSKEPHISIDKSIKQSKIIQSQIQSNSNIGGFAESFMKVANSKFFESSHKVLIQKKQKNASKLRRSSFCCQRTYHNINPQIQSQQSNKYIIPIEKFKDLQDFTLIQQRQCIDLQNLQYDGNQRYNQSIDIIMNHKRDKVKFVDQKRITKFDNGWIQVWNPGKQRIVTNQRDYKVTWFSNGDIKQQFNVYGFVKSYFCKARKVVEVTFGNNRKIYYFPETQQIQTISLDKKLKQVFFADGSYQVIQNNPL